MHICCCSFCSRCTRIISQSPVPAVSPDSPGTRSHTQAVFPSSLLLFTEARQTIATYLRQLLLALIPPCSLENLCPAGRKIAGSRLWLLGGGDSLAAIAHIQTALRCVSVTTCSLVQHRLLEAMVHQAKHSGKRKHAHHCMLGFWWFWSDFLLWTYPSSNHRGSRLIVITELIVYFHFLFILLVICSGCIFIPVTSICKKKNKKKKHNANHTGLFVRLTSISKCFNHIYICLALYLTHWLYEAPPHTHTHTFFFFAKMYQNLRFHLIICSFLLYLHKSWQF